MIIHLLDFDRLSVYKNLFTYLILFILTLTYIISKYQRALYWLVLIHLILYALPNIISFVVLVKFFKIFLVTLLQNMAILLSTIACSINLIWISALDRANARLKPVQEFMNSITEIRSQTETKLSSLTANQLDFSELYLEQTADNIKKLFKRYEEAEIFFSINFDETKNFLNEQLDKIENDQKIVKDVKDVKDEKNEKANIKKMSNEEKTESVINCLHMTLNALYQCDLFQKKLKEKCKETFTWTSFYVCKPIEWKETCKVVYEKIKNKECFKIDQRGLNQTKISSFMNDLNSAKSFLKFGKLKVVQNTRFDFNSSIQKTETYSKVSILLTERVENFFETMQNYWKYLALFFLAISLKKSHKYLKQYVNDITFDNRIITNYFKHLDLRRRSQSKANILPLNPLNNGLACELFDLKLLPFESNSSISYLTLISITILILIAFFINVLFIDILEAIKKYYRVDFSYKSNFSISVYVNGTGFVANKVRNALEKFKNIKTSQTRNMTTTDCVRDVQPLDYEQLFICFLLSFFYVLIQKYKHVLGRFRSRISSLFYPEIEKKRILYLYNGLLAETLKNFKNSLRNLYSKLNSDNEKVNDFSVTEMILEFRNFLLNYFKKETVFKLPFINRDFCRICEQTEKKNDLSTKIHCCERCRLGYCYKCFNYLNSKCLNCDLPNLGNNYNNFNRTENKTKFL